MSRLGEVMLYNLHQYPVFYSWHIYIEAPKYAIHISLIVQLWFTVRLMAQTITTTLNLTFSNYEQCTGKLTVQLSCRIV